MNELWKKSFILRDDYLVYQSFISSENRFKRVIVDCCYEMAIFVLNDPILVFKY